eukprot:PhF_6_TR39692/c0_g1_i2/m.59000
MRILHVLPYLIGITAVFITFSSKIQLRSLLEGLDNFRFFEATQADNSTTRASPRKRQYTEATDGASFSLNIKAFLSHQTPGNTPRNQQEQQRWLNMTNAPLRSAIGNNFVEGMRCEQHHQHRVTYSTTPSPRTKISALTAWTYSMTHVCLNQYGRMYYFPPQSHASEQQVVILRNEIRQKNPSGVAPNRPGETCEKTYGSATSKVCVRIGAHSSLLTPVGKELPPQHLALTAPSHPHDATLNRPQHDQP